MAHVTDEMFGIAGQAAIVTGAGGGLGSEISRALSDLGVRVALADVREQMIRDLERELVTAGREVVAIPVDVTRKAEVRDMADKVSQRYGRIDILVNCAGLSHLEDAVEFNEEKWDRLIEVNLKGTFLTCQAVGSYMIRQGQGRIVNISSVRGLQGRARDLAYAPSKGAINQLTRSLAIEWASCGVNVNAIAPTFVRTDLNRSILEDEDALGWVLRRIPKGRLGECEDIIGPLVFLLSPCSEFVTGQVLYVDGGWTAA